jgi:hypothetical protein
LAISNRDPHQPPQQPPHRLAGQPTHQLPGQLPDQLPGQQRAQLRLRSISWALIAALGAGAIGLALAFLAGEAAGAVELARARGLLDAALRAGGCGFFYGLLAFHLQRVDPDDGHLQAGLVGAVCGLVSLAAPLAGEWSPAGVPLPAVMMAAVSRWLPLWLPLIGSALLLQTAQRQLPVLRP